MKELENLNNKKFAFSCLNLLKDKGCLTQSEIMILTSVEECKRLFCCTKFPVLSEINPHDSVDVECYDEQGRQRFYKEKIYSEGRTFVVSNHWYGPNKSHTDNRTPFLHWVRAKIG